MWEKYTGVLIWKTQNPWPGLRGGLYDFLLDQTGGFFGVQSAAEPVHIQLNLKSHVVEVTFYPPYQALHRTEHGDHAVSLRIDFICSFTEWIEWRGGRDL